MDIKYLKFRLKKYFLRLSETGDSDAIHIPDNYGAMTVMLSSIVSGSVKIQFTLSPEENVTADNAVWYDWSLGSVTTTKGISFDSPVTYIRVVANDNVSYKLELLV